METTITALEEEAWKDIEGFEGRYQISSLGRVKSLGRRCYAKYDKENPFIMKPKIERNGYYRVHLLDKTKSKHPSIHRLVATHFIPNPNNKATVNHIDGDKSNNSIYNLEWASQLENNIHAYSIGLKKGVSKKKLCDKDLVKVRELVNSGIKQHKVAALFNVTQSSISHYITKV